MFQNWCTAAQVQEKITEYTATLNEASISWIGVQFPAPPVPISADKLALANPPGQKISGRDDEAPRVSNALVYRVSNALLCTI